MKSVQPSCILSHTYSVQWGHAVCSTKPVAQEPGKIVILQQENSKEQTGQQTTGKGVINTGILLSIFQGTTSVKLSLVRVCFNVQNYDLKMVFWLFAQCSRVGWWITPGVNFKFYFHFTRSPNTSSTLFSTFQSALLPRMVPSPNPWRGLTTYTRAVSRHLPTSTVKLRPSWHSWSPNWAQTLCMRPFRRWQHPSSRGQFTRMWRTVCMETLWSTSRSLCKSFSWRNLLGIYTWYKQIIQILISRDSGNFAEQKIWLHHHVIFRSRHWSIFA